MQDETPTRDPKTLQARLMVLAGAVILALAVLLLKPFGVAPFIAVFVAGYALMLTGLPRLTKSSRMPTTVFGARQGSRRLAIGLTYGLLTAALVVAIVTLGASPVMAILLMMAGIMIFGLALQPYQSWAFGWTDKLDEYHLGRRRRARSWAYTGLMLVVIAALAGLAAFPAMLTAAHFGLAAITLGILFLTLPAAILGWTEPDHD